VGAERDEETELALTELRDAYHAAERPDEGVDMQAANDELMDQAVAQLGEQLEEDEYDVEMEVDEGGREARAWRMWRARRRKSISLSMWKKSRRWLATRRHCSTARIGVGLSTKQRLCSIRRYLLPRAQRNIC